jgi:hypothetical protein
MEDLVRRACLAGGTIEVEVSVNTVDDLRAELSRRQVDAIIAAKTPNEMSLIPLTALQIQPTLRVVLITTDSGAGDLIELRPQRTHLGEITASEIVHVVNDDAAHVRSWAELTGNPATGKW